MKLFNLADLLRLQDGSFESEKTEWGEQFTNLGIQLKKSNADTCLILWKALSTTFKV